MGVSTGSVGSVVRTRVWAAFAVISLLASACGEPPSSASDPTPTLASTPMGSPTPIAGTVGGYGGLPGAAGIVAPVRSGQTLTVLNGYDNPPPDQVCLPKGYGHDHCANQEYGLDLVPSDPSDLLVLAPVTGRIAWTDLTSGGSGCLGILLSGYPTLNLTVCHLSADVLRSGRDVTSGEVLGLRRPKDGWIHLSLDARYDADGRQLARSAWSPVPFTGPFTIAGVDLPAQLGSPPDLYACRTIVSRTTASGDTALPDPLPAITTIDLSACGVAPSTAPAADPYRRLDRPACGREGDELERHLLGPGLDQPLAVRCREGHLFRFVGLDDEDRLHGDEVVVGRLVLLCGPLEARRAAREARPLVRRDRQRWHGDGGAGGISGRDVRGTPDCAYRDPRLSGRGS